jgi:hypothetical protein
MIEYNNTIKEDLMYFAGDGSYGDASDLVIINVQELDGHFDDFLEEVNEWQRPDFMRWYVDNQGHDQYPHTYTACQVCEHWNEGMNEDEIIEMLEGEENE